MIRSIIRFCGEGLLAPRPTPKLEDLVGCLRLLIEYIRSSPPYWRPFFHPQPEDAPYRGDRDPFNHGTYFLRHKNVYGLLINLEVIWAQLYIRLDYFLGYSFTKIFLNA
jgi:hypothetical protein